MADQYIATLRNLNKSSFPEEEEDRLAALSQARTLVRLLERPSERMFDIAWVQPAFLTSFKTAQDLNLFSHLTRTPQSASDLAAKVHASPDLLRRLIRVLVNEHVIAEGTDAETYYDTDFSEALKDPTGLVTGLDVYYLAGLQQHRLMPEYFKEHNYQNPSDADHAPWKWIEGVPDYEGDRWSYMKTRPEHHKQFNAFMSAIRKDSSPWTDLYSPEKVLENWDEKSVLLVDIGGGNGIDIANFAKAIQGGSHSNARVVLQERAEVINALTTTAAADGSSHLPAQVELMPHNFFDPNPVQGAKVYYMHAVIHDWAESRAHDILVRVREAMQPGYSRLLLFDRVVPERASEWDVKTAALDINMMCNFAALERSEGQWKALLEGAGLKYTGYKKVPGLSSFIEAELWS